MELIEIQSAIMAGQWTSTELDSIQLTIKQARGNLGRQVKRALRVGSRVSWTSSKNPWGEYGVVTKIAQKYVTVQTGQGQLWRVPAGMLIVEREVA